MGRWTPSDTQPKTVTLTTPDDPWDDPDVAFHVALGPAVSTSPDWSGLAVPGRDGTRHDDDDAALVWLSEGPVQLLEGLSTTVQLTLDAAPRTPVHVTPAAEPHDAFSVSPATLVYAPEDWPAPYTVTLTAPDNDRVASPRSSTLWAEVGSEDPAYDVLPATLLSVTLLDNDTASMSWTTAGPHPVTADDTLQLGLTASSRPSAPCACRSASIHRRPAGSPPPRSSSPPARGLHPSRSSSACCPPAPWAPGA